MSDTVTPNLSLTLPTVGADDNTWGGILNSDLVIIDTTVGNNTTAIAAETTRAETAEALKVNASSLATVATSGSYNDLSNKPSIPSAQVSSDWNSVVSPTQILNKPTLGTISSHATTDFDAAGSAATVQTNLTTEITRAETAEALKANISSLATIATSGSYNDLSNKPTIPTVPITTLQNNGISVVPTTGAINFIPGTNVTFSTSGNSITVSSTSTASTAFSALTGSTNTTAALVVGSGSSLATSGTGTITATSVPYSGLTGTVPTWNQNTTGTAAGLSSNITESQVTNLTTDLAGKVATTTTVNGHALSGNVIVSASDITTGTLPVGQLPTIPYSDISGTPTLATVATTGAYSDLTGKPSIPAAQVNSDWNASTGVAQILNKPTLGTASAHATTDFDAVGSATTVQGNLTTEIARAEAAEALLVPQTTTVNGHTLSSNVNVTASDVGLGNVTNDAQTKAAIVPNTAPTAAQLLVGNAGGTAYASVSLSGPISITSTGVTSVAALNQDTTGTAGGLSANIAESQVTNLVSDLAGKVATTTTVNGHALSTNVVVSASDITTGTLPHGQLPALISGDIPNNGANTTGSSGSCTGNSATSTNVAFSGVTAATNTSALVIGTGGSLATSGTGTITATSCPYSGLSGTIPTWNQNTTGTASNLSGTPALPNGTTATTQTLGDNSTKLATTAFVAAATPNINYSNNEIPTGLVNGSNTSYVLAHTPIAGSLTFFYNGLLQNPNSSTDYSLSVATITTTYAPTTGGTVLACYRY